MDRLGFDFGRTAWPYRAAAVRLLLAACAAGALGLALASHLDYRERLQAWQLQLADEAAAVAQAGAGAAGAEPGADTGAQQAARLEHELAAPWDGLLQALEALPADGIALLELAVDAPAGALVITAEARDAASMHAYLRQLAAVPALSGLHLTAQQAQAAGAPRVLRFSANAGWRAMPEAAPAQRGMP